jgi:hypothetical protein
MTESVVLRCTKLHSQRKKKLKNAFDAYRTKLPCAFRLFYPLNMEGNIQIDNWSNSDHAIVNYN